MEINEELTTTEIERVRLQALRDEHRALDHEIASHQDEGRADLFTIKRLKKRKLALKDRIKTLESNLTPDIIA